VKQPATGAEVGGEDPMVKRPKEKVSVCVRVRPLNQIEKRSAQVEAWGVKDGQCVYQTWLPADTSVGATMGADKKQAPKPLFFVYDQVFDHECDNTHVFDHVGRHVVEGTMQGYHGCIFAYGQTSSGKTYTIHGTKDDPGMIPQSVDEVFDIIDRSSNRDFVLRVSYLEIYNEIINDLLEPTNTNLRVREDPVKGVFVENLKEDVVVSATQVFALLSAGESHRHVGRTNYNEVSSRSHTIFRVVVESSPKVGAASVDGEFQGVRQSILNLVDLAGSENAVKAGSAARMSETGYINKSLLTLGHVIYKLTENNTQHIPYRDSKLTRILQSSLDGKACISVVCAISPSSGNLDETISTLKFATRAKKIKASAKINEFFDERTLLKQYRAEIAKLKKELQQARDQAKLLQTQQSLPQDPEKKEAQMQETNALNAQIEQLTRLILSGGATDGGDEKNPDSKKTGALTRTQSKSIAASSPYITSPQTRTRKQPSLKGPVNLAEAAKEVDKLDGKPGQGQELKTAGDQAAKLAATLETSAPAEFKAQLAELVKQVTQLQARLEKSDKDQEALRQENERLRAEIEKQNQTLDEWDRFYVTIKNKHNAIQSRMQEIGSTGVEGDLDAPPDATQTDLGEFKGVPLDDQTVMTDDGTAYEYGFADGDGTGLSDDMLNLDETFDAPLVPVEAGAPAKK
jgi:centromeric protein E